MREKLENADPRQVQIIDVRTQQEFENAQYKFKIGYNLPVQTLESNMYLLNLSQPVYVVCQSGMRAKRASEMLSNHGFKEVYCIKGGFNDVKNCAKSDDPIVAVNTQPSSKVWSMERQVRFSAGAITAFGVAGFFATGNVAFLALPGFIGCGLMYSSVTNTCAMGVALMKMPWNKSISGKPMGAPQGATCPAK